ncbi:MAG: hypothetical protein ABIY55_33255 [Kofleriaceae bacterium]
MKSLVKFGIFGLLAGGTATVVYGEPAGGWLSPNGTSGATSTVATASAPPSAAVGASGTIGTTGTTTTISGTASVGLTGSITLADLQIRVRQLHDQTRADARHVQHLQLIARKEKDVIKLNCVNDKLVQLKPQMNIGDAAEAELESAKDSDRVAIFDAVSQAADNVRRLREEADQCIGEPVGTGGESSNSFTGPKEQDDPTKGFGPPTLEPPGYASPYT